MTVRLALLAIVALIVVGCPSAPSGPAPSSAPSSLPSAVPSSVPSTLPSGSLHLRISKDFDNRADEADLWNAGTISADGVFPVSRLDTIDGGVIYDGHDIGTWSASTQQQSGDFEGECNGSDDCHPCTGDYGGTWPIDSVDFTVQERGNGRYVIDLWFGSENPPKTGGCEPMVSGPYVWAVNLTVVLTGIGSATPAGTVTAWRMGSGSDNAGAGGYTVEVSQ